jgi:DnaK suppressor protein
MLTPRESDQLRGKLEAERERITGKARQALDFAMGRDPEVVGRDSIDVSVEEGIYSTELRLHDREKKLLGKIDEALARLAAGELDQCEDCGDAIGFKRLLARPVTTLCVSCKQEQEAGEAAVGSLEAPDELPAED